MPSNTPRPPGCSCTCRYAASISRLANAAKSQLYDAGVEALALCTCPCVCSKAIGGEPQRCCVCSVTREDEAPSLAPSLSWLGPVLDQLEDDGLDGNAGRGRAPSVPTAIGVDGEVVCATEATRTLPSPVMTPQCHPAEPASLPVSTLVCTASPEVDGGPSPQQRPATLRISAFMCAVDTELALRAAPLPKSWVGRVRRMSNDTRVPAWVLKLALGATRVKLGPRTHLRRPLSTVRPHRPNAMTSLPTPPTSGNASTPMEIPSDAREAKALDLAVASPKVRQ